MAVKIYFSEHPLPQVNWKECSEVPREKLSETFGLKWNDTPDFTDTPYEHEAVVIKELARLIDGKSFEFVVCHINNKVGWGVWTKSSIKKGEAIAVFLENTNEIQQMKVDLRPYLHPVLQKIKSVSQNYLMVDSYKSGNISSFINDKPSKENFIKNYKIIDPSIREENVSYANVEVHTIMFGKISICLVVAFKDIPSGCELGYKYDAYNICYHLNNKNHGCGINLNNPSIYDMNGYDITNKLCAAKLHLLINNQGDMLLDLDAEAIQLDLKDLMNEGWENALVKFMDTNATYYIAPASKLLNILLKTNGPIINLNNYSLVIFKVKKNITERPIYE